MAANSSSMAEILPGPEIPEENHPHCGLLQKVQGNLAIIEGVPVEVPPEIAAELLPMVGQDVLFGCIGGQFMAGLQSHRRPWL